MIHKFLLTERMIIAVAGVLVIGVILATALAYFFIYQPPQFSAYRTSLELNGSSVEKAELYYTDEDMFIKMGTTYTQTYGSGVVVNQSRFGRQRSESCSLYNTRLFVEDTTECHQYNLEGDDGYRVVIRRRDGDIVSLFASAKLGNTNVFLDIPSDQYDEFADYEGWEQYFSSMRPKSLLFTPREYKPSPLREG